MVSISCFLYLCHAVAVLAGDLYSPTGYAYPHSTLVAPQPISSLHYASPLRTSTGYGPLAAARIGNAVAPVYTQGAPIAASEIQAPVSPYIARYSVPTAYSAHVAPVVAPVAPVVSPVVQKYAAVPTITNVPVTRYDAQPGYIQKYVDVAHPQIATSKIQIRRPALQKQFYDIEERIVVRPIASAVVEFDPPLSKSQAGPTVISSAVPSAPGIISAAPLPISHLPPVPAYGPPQPLPPPSAPGNPQYPSPSAPESPQYPSSSAPGSPQYPSSSAPGNPQFPSPSAPESPFQPSAPQNPTSPDASAPGNGQESDDSDSITVENVDARARTNMQENQRSRRPQLPQAEERNQQQSEETETEQPEARSNAGPSAPQQIMSQTEARFLSRPQLSVNSFNNFVARSQFNTGSIIPSSRAQLTEEQSQSNQQQLIELLTGRGGIAEVRSGVSIDAAGEAGQIRGRVLSVTPAPQTSNPSDERVSTRRIVVSRPIQTLQEVDVVQPYTKVHRLSVQHPAILKTPRVDYAPVRTYASVPVAAYSAYTPYTYVH